MDNTQKLQRLKKVLGNFSSLFEDDELIEIIEEEVDINNSIATALEIVCLLSPEALVESYSDSGESVSKKSILEMAKYYREKGNKSNLDAFFI